MPFQLMGSKFYVLLIQHDWLEKGRNFSATKENLFNINHFSFVEIKSTWGEAKRVTNFQLAVRSFQRLFIGLHVSTAKERL